MNLSDVVVEQVYLDFTNKLTAPLAWLASRLAPTSHKRGLGRGDGEKYDILTLRSNKMLSS
ncbi:MAG: hypothetical protein WAV28_02475 [Sedimentisphaerales bacterium]|jgi:hypothetical protein